MAKRAAQKNEITQTKIMEAALVLFRERGFENTTMREIAAAAGVATGAAYYYFDSKDAIVMASYQKAQAELAPQLDAKLAAAKSLESRLRILIEGKLHYFAENRRLLGALTGHINPREPLSPFSEVTAPVRNDDIQRFSNALAGAAKVPDDLVVVLPEVLWIYLMGIILFWVLDESEDQSRTKLLLDKSLKLVTGLIQFAGLPLMKPLRRRVVELVGIIRQ